MPTTRVCLLRHGETEANALGILQGQSESNLTSLGQQQAHQLGAALRARLDKEELTLPLCSTVYSSDLRRASDTAKICIEELAAHPSAPQPLALALESRLRERRLGPFQGKAVNECTRLYPRLWAAFNTGDDQSLIAATDGADGGCSVETSVEIDGRADAALQYLVRKHPGETILAVSHGGCIHTAVCVATGADARRVPHIGNCSITTLEVTNGGTWRAVAVGERTGTVGDGPGQGANVDLGAP